MHTSTYTHTHTHYTHTHYTHTHTHTHYTHTHTTHTHTHTHTHVVTPMDPWAHCELVLPHTMQIINRLLYTRKVDERIIHYFSKLNYVHAIGWYPLAKNFYILKLTDNSSHESYLLSCRASVYKELRSSLLMEIDSISFCHCGKPPNLAPPPSDDPLA